MLKNDAQLDSWFEKELVCPRDRSDLRRDDAQLICAQHHTYPIADGIPIMLVREVTQTAPAVTARSLAFAEEPVLSYSDGSCKRRGRSVRAKRDRRDQRKSLRIAARKTYPLSDSRTSPRSVPRRFTRSARSRM